MMTQGQSQPHVMEPDVSFSHISLQNGIAWLVPDDDGTLRAEAYFEVN